MTDNEITALIFALTFAFMSFIGWRASKLPRIRPVEPRTYPLTLEQMAALAWPTVSQREPAIGQRCEFWLLERDYSTHGIGQWFKDEVSGFGRECRTVAGFGHERGTFVSDPRNTYWRPLGEALK